MTLISCESLRIKTRISNRLSVNNEIMKLLKKISKSCQIGTILQIIVLFSNVSFAQTEFYKEYGNSSSDILYDLVKLESNSYLATGYTYNAVGKGKFLTKIDTDGTIVWNKVIGTENSIGYVVYPFNSRIFLGGKNTKDGGNAEITCVDHTGNLLFTKEFDLGGNEEIVSISRAGNDLILIGNTNAFGNSFDILFLKMDTLGNVLLSKKIGTNFSEETAQIIKCNDDSGFLIIGSTSENNYDALLTKINTDGEVLWSNRYGGNDAENLSDGIELENGNFVFTGTSFSFGNVSNDGDIWILSTDHLGNIVYSKNFGQYGTDRGKRIVKANKDSYFISGETWSYGNEKSNAYILGINSAGNATHFETFGGNLFDYGVSILSNSDNTLTFAGYTSSFGFGSSDFFISKKELESDNCYANTFEILNNDTNPTKVFYPISDSSIAVISTQLLQESINLFQVDAICDSTLGIAENTWNPDFIIIPNPVINTVTIQALDENNPIIEVSCYDVLGKQILQQKQTATEITLDLKDYSAGIYTVIILSNDKNARIQKIVKE